MIHKQLPEFVIVTIDDLDYIINRDQISVSNNYLTIRKEAFGFNVLKHDIVMKLIFMNHRLSVANVLKLLQGKQIPITWGRKTDEGDPTDLLSFDPLGVYPNQTRQTTGRFEVNPNGLLSISEQVMNEMSLDELM